MIKFYTTFFCILFFTDTVFAVSSNGIDAPKDIHAEKIEYDLKSQTIKTTGKTEITNNSGQRMTLSDTYISQNGMNISGNDIELWLGSHIYVKSENITKDNDITLAQNATFTACKNCDEYGQAWEMSATKIRHNADTKMLAFYMPVLWVYDIPVLWLPYFDIPDPSVKHKSGFLTPDMESTNKMGTRVTLPFYVYISNYQDITITPSYQTQENPLFQLEHRLNSDHSEFRTRGSFTHNRDGKNRWHVFNKDVVELGEHARAHIEINRASDKTYLQKYGFYNGQPYLDSGANIEFFAQQGYFVADTHIFQELRSSKQHYSLPPGDILPNIRGTYQTSPIYKETYFTLSGDVLSVLDKSQSYQRIIGETRIVSPWTLWGGNRITASVATRYDFYNFSNTQMIDGQEYSGIKTRFLPNGYLEWGLPLFRPSTTWTQVIEPRARLTIMNRIQDKQFTLNNDSAGALLSDVTLFSGNRFSGLDLWENGTFADYGVRWAAFDSSGKNIETFFGQTYDFINHNTTTDLNSGFRNGASDYVGRIAYNNMDWLNLYSRFRLARDDFSLRHAETNIKIGSNQNYFNLGHIWSKQFLDLQPQDDNINEIIAGTGIKITDRWSLVFNAIYNITYDHFQQHNGALYYYHPCYYLSFGYRRDNAIKEDYVGNTTFQFRIGMSIDGKPY